MAADNPQELASRRAVREALMKAHNRANPTWGQQPFQRVLPDLLDHMARDAARAGGQRDPELFVTVALMPSGWVSLALGPDAPGAGATPAPPRLALAWRVFQGDGRPERADGRWRLVSEHYSPLATGAIVAPWLRG